MVFDPWIGDIVSIPCLHGRCKRDPGVLWRHKTQNPGVEKRDPGVESLIASTHCSYPWKNGQAELAWVAGFILRWLVRPVPYMLHAICIKQYCSIRYALATE